jgi:hypothetical protein
MIKLFVMLVICGTVPLAANCKSPNAQPSSQSAAQAAKESSPQTATPNPCKGFDPLTDPDNLELRKKHTITIEGYPKDYTLKEALDHFNERARCHPIGKTQPPLTETELLTAVLSIPGSDPEPYDVEKTYLRDVFEKKILPKGSLINVTTGFQHVGHYFVHYWRITLRFDLDIYPDTPSIPGKPDPRHWFLIRLQHVSYEPDIK